MNPAVHANPQNLSVISGSCAVCPVSAYIVYRIVRRRDVCSSITQHLQHGMLHISSLSVLYVNHDHAHAVFCSVYYQ